MGLHIADQMRIGPAALYIPGAAQIAAAISGRGLAICTVHIAPQHHAIV